jgi:peptidoglycan/LPS O-acetylase OafA/YrhL
MHIRYLDGIRGIAILMVVIHHCVYFPNNGFGRLMNPLLNSGRLGVPIFFTLSGFLMGILVFSKKEFSIRSFWIRRISKIYPPFIISIIAVVIYIIFHHGFSGVFEYIIFNITTVYNFLENPFKIVNPVFWSLFVEIQFYIIFPIIYIVSRKYLKNPEIYSCVIIFLASLIGKILVYFENIYGWSSMNNVFPMGMINFVPGLVAAIIFLKIAPNSLETQKN